MKVFHLADLLKPQKEKSLILHMEFGMEKVLDSIQMQCVICKVTSN